MVSPDFGFRILPGDRCTEEVEAFPAHLALEKNGSASVRNQAFKATLFCAENFSWGYGNKYGKSREKIKHPPTAYKRWGYQEHLFTY